MTVTSGTCKQSGPHLGSGVGGEWKKTHSVRRGDLFYHTRAQLDLIRQAMMTKKGKSKMSLTKAWWMKNFVHLHGTSLKSDPK
eukprot:5210793-Prorocentrum_lima.AAC.1